MMKRTWRLFAVLCAVSGPTVFVRAVRIAALGVAKIDPDFELPQVAVRTTSAAQLHPSEY